MIEVFDKKYLSSKEAASMFGFSRTWLDKMRTRQQGPTHIKIGGSNRVYYEYDSLKNWWTGNNKE